LAELTEQDGPATPAVPGKGSWIAAIRRVAQHKRRHELAERIADEVAVLLRAEKGAVRDWHKGFFEIGMDSLMAVELKSRLEVHLACSLPRTLAFEHPCVWALADWLLEQSGLNGSATTACDSPDKTRVDEGELSDLEQLSEAELIRRIEEELPGSD
jgi:acyl carrier protein